ncbi:MAG: SH3 domain-containing protein [Chloroflexota bacterium]
MRILFGLLGLGIGLGVLFGLNGPPPSSAQADPLVDEYVRLVGLLYAKGESLSTVEAWLDRVNSGDNAQLVRLVAARSTDTGSTLAAHDDLSGVLLALAPSPEPMASASTRLIASGKGAGPTPTPLPEAVVLSATAPTISEFPKNGRVSPTKGDAALRSEPSLRAPALRLVKRGTDLVLLGVERGQVVEGAEERWYRVRQGDATGYVYFTLVETTQ